MAVAKVSLLEPLTEPALEINQAALVIGGGVAGMATAKNLAEQGYRVYLIERGGSLGGYARSLHETWKGEDVQAFLDRLMEEVTADDAIQVLLNARIEGAEGFVGNFKTTVDVEGEKKVIEHGVTIIATGAKELKPDQFLYGEDPRVITAMELERRFISGDPSLKEVKTAVFVQCVGSRIPERPYCSKVCCTRSIKNALKLKAKNPRMNVYVLYRDMRPYGLREDLYREARTKGVAFLRYEHGKPMNVEVGDGDLNVTFTDRVLRREMEVRPDLLILASAIVPADQSSVAQMYKVPLNEDGFFMEAHVKLRPVDFATDGVFVCGLAHAPKSLDESITQAQAAAARAVTLLSAGKIHVSGTVAHVDPLVCSSCGVCLTLCPYGAPKWNEKNGKAEIEATLCKGCGLCVASCRSGALHLKGFDTGQIMSMIQEAM
jgi:heterodisulfide reductase subunit A